MQSLRNKRGSETKSGTKDVAEAHDADVAAEEKHQVVMTTQSLDIQRSHSLKQCDVGTDATIKLNVEGNCFVVFNYY